MIIYVDVLFIENLILDFIIILATGIICNFKIKFYRIFFASCVGSIFSIICTLLNINQIIIKIFISIVIVLVGYGFKNRKRFLKALGVFYLTTITFGGASFLMLFSVNPEKIIYNAGQFFGTYPVKMAIVRWNFWFLFNCSNSKIFTKKI